MKRVLCETGEVMSIIRFNIDALGKPVQIPLWYTVITT